MGGWTWKNFGKNWWAGPAGGFSSSNIWDDFTTSPREKQGQLLGQQQMASWDDIMKEIGGLKSVYDDPSKIAGYNKTVQGMFAPARSNLTSALSRSRSAEAERMGARNATPEVSFGNIESAYAPAFGGIEENAMQTLNQVLQGENQYGLNKVGMKSGALSGKNAAIQAYLNSLSGDSTFDDILGLGTTAAKMYMGFSNDYADDADKNAKKK